MRMRGRRGVLVLAGVGMVLGAAAAVSPLALAEPAAERLAPTMDDSGSVMEFAPMGINQLVSFSEAAALVEVDAVGAPRWNSADGEAWSESWESVVEGTDSHTVPMRFRDLKVSVGSVLWDTPGLRLAQGEAVTIRLNGSGEPGGPQIDLPYGPATWNELSGRVAEGDELLVLLTRRRFPLREGYEDVLAAVGHYMAIWRIRGSQAVSEDPQRSVPLAALSAVLTRERAAGKRELEREQDLATVRDPLAPTPGLGPFGGLRVDAARQQPPPDPDKARGEIESAFAAVYAGANPTERLASIVGAEQFRSYFGDNAVEQFTTALPKVEVAVTAVFFDSPTQAQVEYQLSSAELGTVYRQGAVVQWGGRWLVTFESVCADLARVGVACPG